MRKRRLELADVGSMELFSYNIVVLIVFSLAAFSAAFAYTATKKRLYLYEAMLTALFLLDHFIIFAAQFLFNSFPTSGTVASYITAPDFKIIILVARQVVYLLVAKELFGLEYPKWTYLVFPLIFVLYWNLQTPITTQSGYFQLFLFYSVMQAYLLVLCAVCYAKTRLEEFANLKQLIAVSVVLLVLTVAFDVLWTLDLYNPLMAIFGFAHESNVFETLLHLLYSILIIKAVVELLRQHMARSSQLPQQAEPSDANIDKAVRDLRLTRREEEVFRLLLEDYSYQEICDELVVSMSTVKSHAHNIYDKAGCSRRGDLKRLVLRGGSS